MMHGIESSLRYCLPDKRRTSRTFIDGSEFAKSPDTEQEIGRPKEKLEDDAVLPARPFSRLKA